MIGAESKDPEDISFAKPQRGVLTMHSRLGSEPKKIADFQAVLQI
jgi:hypothetical protein